MISLVRWGETAVRDAVSLCDGLAALRPGDRVLIKPNLPLGGEIMAVAPGMYTDPAVVEGIVRVLKDHAVSDITIGEGTVAVPSLGSTTNEAFSAAGYTALQQRYGVDLVDFNTGRFIKQEFGELRFAVSASVLDHDFLINAPCLKTHAQTRISLAMKNLKGLLDTESRKVFHREGLDEHIAALNRVVRSDLVVVDGLLALEYGPVSDLARDTNLILAGTDVFEADIVGGRLLGFAPEEIGFLRCYERLANRSSSETVEIRGEAVDEHAAPSRWRAEEWSDLYSAYGIEGIRIEADRTGTVCSMCHFALLGAFDHFGSSRPNQDLGDVEIVLGMNRKNLSGTTETLLCGSCPVTANEGLDNAVQIAGCPPAVQDIVDSLELIRIRHRYRRRNNDCDQAPERS